MAAPTYSITGLVLRKTKLGEADVICSILTNEGIMISAVAKGARKPKSSFSSRLELFSICDLLLVKGKSLDIVKEARLVEGHSSLRSNYDAVILASPILEVLRKASVGSIPNPKLYDMALAALLHFEKANTEQGLYLCAAFMLKTLAFLGFKPSFTHCIGCGTPVASDVLISFSSLEGGVVCQSCFFEYETTSISGRTLAWAHSLLMAPFSQVMTFEFDGEVAKNCLRLSQQLLGDHLGIRLKSMNYLFTQIDFSTACS